MKSLVGLLFNSRKKFLKLNKIKIKKRPKSKEF